MFRDRNLHSKIVRFLKDKDEGTVAVEAGFALPGLMLFFLGFLTILSMQNASTSVGKVTYTVADILTQVRQLDARSVDCAFMAGESLMNNQNSSNLQMMMAGLTINQTDNTAIVSWSRGRNLSFRALPPVGTNLAGELPPELMNNTTGFVVLAEGHLRHTGYMSDVLNEKNGYTPFNFKYKNYFIPRITNDGIPCPDCNTAPATPC